MEVLMKSQGIRISDATDNVVSVTLIDILEEIQKGNEFNWSILFLWAIGHLGMGKSVPGNSIPVFEDLIRKSLKGFFINWDDLLTLTKKFQQIIDLTLIGCRDKNLLKRYEDDKEMYETCDIVIQMIDGCFWEVFSNDYELINRLATKFKKIEFLKPDFKDEYILTLNGKKQNITPNLNYFPNRPPPVNEDGEPIPDTDVPHN